MRTVRIRDRNGFETASPFSSVQAYSQIPQPVHLLGSTETNFLSVNFCCVIVPIASFSKYLSISVNKQGIVHAASMLALESF